MHDGDKLNIYIYHEKISEIGNSIEVLNPYVSVRDNKET